MSTLYLIRHGQASFGAANYDVLSELGAAQSRRLGALWGERKTPIDACYAGPRTRQIDSATLALESARAAGMSYPEPERLAELDEYPAFEIIEQSLPGLIAEDPELGQLVPQMAGAGTGEMAGRLSKRSQLQRFERAFELITHKWVRGELDTRDLESFVEFRVRVDRGLRHIMTAQGRQKRVAVFTSGGVIAIAMNLTLGLAPEMTMRVAAVIANSSISEFRYRDPDSLSLIRFNAIPHLPDPAEVTYR